MATPTKPAAKKPAAAKPKKCPQCGVAGAIGVGAKHKVTCPDYRCDHCGRTANTHDTECPNHRENQAEKGVKAARAEAAARKTERAPVGTFFSVKVDRSEIDALQKIINEGFFSGDSQRQNVCEYEEPGDAGGVTQCSNIAPPGMTQVVKNHCPTCQRDKRESVLRLCVLHAAKCWGGGSPHHLQTAMDLK
jgi:hypothetical protein